MALKELHLGTLYYTCIHTSYLQISTKTKQYKPARKENYWKTLFMKNLCWKCEATHFFVKMTDHMKLNTEKGGIFY